MVFAGSAAAAGGAAAVVVDGASTLATIAAITASETPSFFSDIRSSANKENLQGCVFTIPTITDSGSPALTALTTESFVIASSAKPAANRNRASKATCVGLCMMSPHL